MRVFILDSTLRDGMRADRVWFGAGDKLLILRRLDAFGVDYIDGGWAGSERDRDFFKAASHIPLAHARLVATGSPRHVDQLLECDTPVVCVASALSMIGNVADAIGALKRAGREVIYNAEHFFDAWETNPGVALAALHTAYAEGVDVICLCDSNGGTLTSRLESICHDVRRSVTGTLGIHAHNDADLAVANTLAAVEQGFAHVQGCINGYGERCGCANLCSILPNLELKAGHMAIGRANLERLNGVAHFVAELANLPVPPEQPYVGSTAGTADLHYRIATDPLAIHLTEESRRELMDALQAKEHEGYNIAGADGTFELLLRESIWPWARFFTTLSYDVSTRMVAGRGVTTSASVSVEVQDAVLTGSAEGLGPIHALETALRQCLLTVYPAVGKVRLADYKVRVLDAHRGSAARVRVLAEWSDGERSWATAGVSDNIIEASWLALTSAVKLELLRLHVSVEAPQEDYSWAV